MNCLMKIRKSYIYISLISICPSFPLETGTPNHWLNKELPIVCDHQSFSQCYATQVLFQYISDSFSSEVADT